jgi:NarL family two-component system response regulator LiaR
MTDPVRKIRVLIVDDHQIVRQGLRTFLDLQQDIEVVGEAADGPSAVEASRRLEPDIVLMDLVMPGGDGVQATRRIHELGGQTQVIVLTSFTEDDKVFPAIQAGAASYLLKDVTPDDLVAAVRAVHRGEARLHPEITRRLMREVAHPEVPQPQGPTESLTDREIDVARRVAEGRSNQEIAQELVISEKTVKTHVSNILAKLRLSDRTQLAIYVIRSGLAEDRRP